MSNFLDSLDENIQKEIDHLNGRISRGIAYDFNKMKRLWGCELEILTKLQKSFREIKGDVLQKETAEVKG